MEIYKYKPNEFIMELPQKDGYKTYKILSTYDLLCYGIEFQDLESMVIDTIYRTRFTFEAHRPTNFSK